MQRHYLILALGWAGCTASDPSTADNEAASSACSFNDQSLIETDSAIVNDTNFSLQAVFDQIRTTTPTSASDPVSIPSSALPMFQEIYAAFADCTSSPTIDPNGYGLSCRPNEASLQTMDPFTTTGTNPLHYFPVALVNRIDLAPSDFSYCGESRIVFWKIGGVVGRAAINVELRTPSVLIDGSPSCEPVAAFWGHLATVTDVATRTSLLSNFYFRGIAGTPSKPVMLSAPPISAIGAGFDGAGQVRLNSFVGEAQWNLREFKWKKVCTTTAGATTCSAHFVEQSVKKNPSQLLFAGTHPNAPAFQDWFVSTATPALASATELTSIALDNAPVYDTYESVSEPFAGDPTSVDYQTAASASLRARITGALPAGSTLTADDILVRAQTQTCGGCHQLSRGAELGGGLPKWPAPNLVGFTMIDENANLAPALTNVFLPFRLQVLESIACSPAAAGTDGSLTVGGLPVGAPN